MQLTYLLEVLARTLEWLPALPSSDLPPSAWGRTIRRTPRSEMPVEREKVLNRVRALLAKAEATQFGGEAELLTAKAQDLMTRHAIDEAMLHQVVDDVTVITRRIRLHSPYISTKVSLLNAVGQANRTRVVHLESVDMAFLTAYAVRIGERLADASAGATASYGSELVTVLRAQEQAVQAEFDRLFPNTSSRGPRSFDAYGWEAGRQAADRARFVTGRITA